MEMVVGGAAVDAGPAPMGHSRLMVAQHLSWKYRRADLEISSSEGAVECQVRLTNGDLYISFPIPAVVLSALHQLVQSACSI